MSEQPSPFRLSNDDLEALVRTHLLRQAETVSPEEMLVRIKTRRKASRRPVPRRSRRWGWLVVASAAAALVFAFFGGQSTPTARASAEMLLREAKRVHALPLDRCYLVQVDPVAGGPLEKYPRFVQNRGNRLWTRGDRFFLESNEPQSKWAWGQDEQGGIWMALSRRRGIRFDQEETRETLGMLCDVYSMRVETLLDDVLNHFALRREDEPGATTHVVRVTPRWGMQRSRLRSATLEIDPETKVLRRLVLERAEKGRPLATVTFTLIETRNLLDAAYTLEGHLDPGAPVYSRTFEQFRRAGLLRNQMGIPLNERKP